MLAILELHSRKYIIQFLQLIIGKPGPLRTMNDQFYIVLLFLLLLVAVQASWDTTMSGGEMEVALEGSDRVFSEEEPHKVYGDMLVTLGNTNYFGDDFWSLVDEAIDKRDYASLKGLYPAGATSWGKSEYAKVLLLAKAYGHTEWMSEEEWQQHSGDIDWKLYFRVLIRSKNNNVYQSAKFRDMIFQNKIFWDNFGAITQEAYDSKNFNFLKSVPTPNSPDHCPHLWSAFWFWSFSYKKKETLDQWDEYIEKLIRKEFEGDYLATSKIFSVNNPEVFKFKPIREFLKDRIVSEHPLITAMKHDCPAFARYLLEKYGQSQFNDMVEGLSSSHTADYWKRTYEPVVVSSSRIDRQVLSRAYNVLLETVCTLDISNIHFCDVASLDKEVYLEQLLASGFDEEPLNYYEVIRLATTKIGISFLKRILKGDYKPNGKLLKVSSDILSQIRPDILDIELFKLIDARFPPTPTRLSITQEAFRLGWTNMAAEKDDVNFFIATSLLPSPDALYKAILNGNFAVFDWIFEKDCNFFAEFKGLYMYPCSFNPCYIPTLSHLYKKSVPCELLNDWTKGFLSGSTRLRSKDDYDQVIAIEGVIKAFERSGATIPKFIRPWC